MFRVRIKTEVPFVLIVFDLLFQMQEKSRRLISKNPIFENYQKRSIRAIRTFLQILSPMYDYIHILKKWFLWLPGLKNNKTKIELSLQKSTSFRTRYSSTSGSIFFYFRLTKKSEFRVKLYIPQSFMQIGPPV